MTIAILAGALVYTYTTATGQISSLKTDGKNLCAAVESVVNSISGVYSDTTQTMQQQIQEDNSIIAALNSTKPSGYAGIISALQAQETQDFSIIASMNNLLSGPTELEPSPCESFN
jgi:hypothetical protein